MLNKLAIKLTSKLLAQNVISGNLSDIYVYGFELLLSFLFSTSVILVMGIFFGRIFETITFLVVFISLRSFTGGYHAKKYWFCSAVTFSIFGVILFLSKYAQISLLLYALFGLIGIVIIAITVPIESPNKPLSNDQKKKYRSISLALFIFFVALGAAINYIDNSIGSVVFFTLMADLLLLFIKNRKERRLKA